MSNKTERTIIAIDVGRSAVKAKAFHNGRLTPDVIFPSIVALGYSLSFQQSQSESALDTVHVDGQTYFIGETARIHSKAASSVGLSDDWIQTPKYKALLLATMNRFRAHHGIDDVTGALVVVGTPSSIYGGQRDVLEKITREILNCEVKALPQPMGAYLSHVYDDGGVPMRDRVMDSDGRRRTWAVVDIGLFTTDFLLMEEGKFVESKSYSCSGMQLACEHLARIVAAKRKLTLTPLECQEIIQTRKMRDHGEKDMSIEVDEALTFLADEILTTGESLYSRDVRKFDGILVAGGVAPAAAPAIQKQWQRAIAMPNARTAVAEGYIKFGRFYEKLKRQASDKVTGAA